MPTDLDVARRAAEAAADVILRARAGGVETEFKGAVDPVTAVDRAAEDVLVDIVSRWRPDDRLVGEERGGTPGPGRTWYVDPLDGTVNFVHRIPHVAVSVALCEGTEPVVGVIVDVFRSEIFVAEAGRGAWRNGERMTVSDVVRLDRALTATGFPYDRQEKADVYTDPLRRALSRTMGVRRMGSAALDLAWTAAGRFDAYWEHRLSPWDAASGILIVKEAGGTVTGYGGAPHGLGAAGVVATNGRLHEEMVAVVGHRST